MKDNKKTKKDWPTIIAYLQISGAFWGFWHIADALDHASQVANKVWLLLYLIPLAFYSLGLFSSYLILKKKASGTALSKLFWGVQILFFSTPTFQFYFYSLPVLILGLSFPATGATWFANFGLASGFMFMFGGSFTSYVSINLVPFVIFGIWSRQSKLKVVEQTELAPAPPVISVDLSERSTQELELV